MSEKALAIIMFGSGLVVMLIIGCFLYMVDMDTNLFSGIILACLLSALAGYCFGYRKGRRESSRS